MDVINTMAIAGRAMMHGNATFDEIHNLALAQLDVHELVTAAKGVIATSDLGSVPKKWAAEERLKDALKPFGPQEAPAATPSAHTDGVLMAPNSFTGDGS